MYTAKGQTQSKDKGSGQPRTPGSAVRSLNGGAGPQIHPAAIFQRAQLDPGSVTAADMLQLQRSFGNRAVCRLMASMNPIQAPVQLQPDIRTPNHTGMPDHLKAGVESLSGISMDDVRVHYNSDKPTGLEALAYTQGTDIHLGPGQERHLAHEAWHVVQQKQGRVRPMRQLKGKLEVNDDQELEREADRMGAQAVQMKSAERAGNISRQVAGSHPGGVIQLYDKLKIGISGATKPIKVSAEDIQSDATFVWILSNQKGNAGELDTKGVTKGTDKSKPKEIIEANQANVNKPLLYQRKWKKGVVIKGVFQSGVFIIPRQGGSDASGIDYSFLRFAAMESYKSWYSATGKSDSWPDISADSTLLETIDSDHSGITGDTGTSSNNNNKENGEWLAEAGIYRWDWQDVKDDDRINHLFEKEGVVDKGKRDKALQAFADVYTEAETTKREAVSGTIFKIYFPEPATRISSYAVALLSESGFANMKISVGQQLGFGRESIGLIAALVYLDKVKTRQSNYSRAKAKLKFNSKYVVTTGLGKRKEAYVSLFINWYSKILEGRSDKDLTVFNGLTGVNSFDQSYLKSDVPDQVERWHNSSLAAMEDADSAAKTFFHPRS